MRSRLVLGVVATGALLFGLAVPVITASAGSAGAVYTIGVGHEPPGDHNWDYTDFFPRDGVNVHHGDVVGFQWASAPDGFHTATVLMDGETPDQAWFTNYPLIVPDPEDGPSQLILNPAVNNPTDPSCGDTDVNPCVYDGTSDFNSGAFGTDGTTGYFVQMEVTAGTTVNYVCLIHPGMAGAINVVPDEATASTQAELDAAAATQAAADTAGALVAEEAASAAAVATNPDGTRTFTMTAGTAAPHVEVLEFLPHDLSVNVGDTVKYETKGNDPHTVTFPSGAPEGSPFVPVCEGDPDTPFDPTQSPPCGDPSLFELEVRPAPGGATEISSPTTFGTSGLIGVPDTPTEYSFAFPSGGTFEYYCAIHTVAMVGTVDAVEEVEPPILVIDDGDDEAPPATPVETEPTLTG